MTATTISRNPRAAVLVTALLLCASAQAARAEVAIIDWGIVERAPTIGTTPSDTLVGRNRVVDPNVRVTIAEQTTDIPACIGTRFGILYRTVGSGRHPGRIDVRVEHPEQVTQDGRRSSTSRWQATVSGQPLYTGWHFDEPYELVAGTWTFILSANGRELARQSFTVHRTNCALTS